MNFPRKQIKANARAALSANYWPVVGSVFVGVILIFGISAITEIPSLYSEILAGTYGNTIGYASAAGTSSFGLVVLSALCEYVFGVGLAAFCFNVYTAKKPDIMDLFVAFKDGRLGRVLGGMFLVSLYTALWTLLFIIPGIIKGYQYSMVPYLLYDRPDLTVKECFEMSKQMTDGHKGDLFVLDLSFIGWGILTACTIGIAGIFYVSPYVRLASAGAYHYLKTTRMTYPEQAFSEQPVFQSASYDADYTATADTAEKQETVDTVVAEESMFEE